MRAPVERSQSLRLSADSRAESPASSLLRPKVSFNRAVHVKRISRRLADVVEDEDSPDYSETRRSPMPSATNGFSTIPRRGNGVKSGMMDGPAPSDRLSRLIRHDPKPEDQPERQTQNERTKDKKKKTLSERVRGMFSPKRSPSRKDPGKQDDELKARYSEFKGRNSSSDATDNDEREHRMNGKRRGSAPETRASWFRSIDRIKKGERYFGDSDRRVDSSADSEAEGMHRAPSLVYLHTAAVGDIPQRAVSPTRRLSRSVSVLAPWAPRLRPPRPAPGTRTRATQTEPPPPEGSAPVAHLRPPPRASPRHHAGLPKLVFTGPSIEETVGSRTLSRPGTGMRGRK